MLLVLATNCIVVFCFCLLALAASESSSNEAFITFVRTLTDRAAHTRANELAKQLSYSTTDELFHLSWAAVRFAQEGYRVVSVTNRGTNVTLSEVVAVSTAGA